MSWAVESSQILQPAEMAAVLADLRRRSRRSLNSRMNLVIFRLAACCGLRVSEIAGLDIADVHIESSRPHIRVRRGKGGKSRRVPLTWDAGTLADLADWRRYRQEQGGAPYVCSQHQDSLGSRLDRRNLRRRFITACKVLGRPVTIHDGRHTFVSHALHGGRSVVEVRAAAGHASLATTSVYTHLVETDGTVGNLFAY